MKGFFKIEPQEKIIRKRKKSNTIKDPCTTCGLDKKVNSPKMPITGEGKLGIYIRAMSPGETEDKENEQLIGKAGQLLRNYLPNNIDLDRDFYKDNSVRCHTPNNREPTNKELNCCRIHINKDLEELKPKKIILAGNAAVHSFLNDRMNNIKGITRWNGWAIPDQLHKAWVFPTFHPSYILRNEDNIVLKRLFKQQLKQAIYWNKPFPVYWDNEKEKQNINIILDLDKACDILRMILKKVKLFAFDIEATGLKPHREGHEIISISISINSNQAFAFPFFKNKKFQRLIKKIFTNSSIKKIAHNLKLEETWFRVILGYKIEGWAIDTMQLAHILDNREGITSLKFLVYIYFGVLGYDDKIKDYIKGIDEKDGNSFNRLKELPIEDVLLYNGFDSMYTNRLSDILVPLAKKEKLLDPHNFYLDGILAFADMEQTGISVNTNYYLNENKKLERNISILKRKILNSKEIKQWEFYTSKKINNNLVNVLSDQIIRTILFDINKEKPKELTEKKQTPKVDQKNLERFRNKFPIIDFFLKLRKDTKLKNTYLAGFLRESVDNKLHPSFNLNLAKTFRSSCNRVNFQNIPVRSKRAQKITRQGIIPSPGNQILEADYKTLEVGIGACYHKDPVMIDYLNDKSKDMHRDQALDLFFLNKYPEQLTKDIRYGAKSDFVFASFYGSFWRQTAPELWEYTVLTENLKSDMPLREHLRDNGINNFRDFEEHVQDIEDKLWRKFKVYYKWRDNIWEEYLNNGFLHYYTGFKISGIMTKNEVTNASIQGTAFQCLLWSLIKLNKELKEKEFKTKIAAQIHDNLFLDLCPEEKSIVIPLIKKISCKDIKKFAKWINVPLNIEMEISKIDSNWYEMESIEC